MDALRDRQIHMARHLLDAGQPQRALDALAQVAGAAEDAEALAIRASAYLAMEKPQTARESATAGLALDPQDTTLLAILAEAHLAEGDLPGAERALLEAIRLEPESSDLIAGYAIVVARAGLFDKAKKLAARAQELEPAARAVYRAHFVIATLEGRTQDAEAISRTWLAEHPDDASALMTSGLLLSSVGRAEAGLRRSRDAVALDPSVAEGAQEGLLEQRLLAHPALLPLWPFQKFGVGGSWGIGIGGILILRALGFGTASVVWALIYIALCVYSWIAPGLLRRHLRRRFRA